MRNWATVAHWSLFQSRCQRWNLAALPLNTRWTVARGCYCSCRCCAGWYQTCTEALQRYQNESVLNEEAVWQRERENYVKELKDELKDIWDANAGHGTKGFQCFLRHLYKTYPPKNLEHKLCEKELEAKPKKVLMSAILHYHPDKQDKKKHGSKWFVLCEEITKQLNRCHESTK